MKELIKIQTELKAPKTKKNNFGGYMYRSLEDIQEALKPLLAHYGCFITLSDEIELIGERYYICATAKIVNSEGQSVSVQAYAREEEHKKGMDAAQITGSASSYARKYALNALFAIDDTRDADATNTHEDVNITPTQVKELEELIASTGRDKAKMLEYYKVSKVSELKESQFYSIKKLLSRSKNAHQN